MQTLPQTVQQGLTPAQIETLAQAGVIPAGTPPAIVQVFATACQQHGLSPFRKEIYLVPYNTKSGMQYHTIVGIDGLQQKAARTNQFAGCDVDQYDLNSKGEYKTAAELKAAKAMPVSCTVTVYRVVGGIRCPFVATAVFDEYYPAVASGRDLYGKAATMPFNMIAKCARAKALKMAFSDELSGLHIEEEQAAFEDVTVQAASVNPSAGVNRKELEERIAKAQTVDQLHALYNENKAAYKAFAELFAGRKNEIIETVEPVQNEG